MSYQILCTARRWFTTHSVLINDIEDETAANAIARELKFHFQVCKFFPVRVVIISRQTGNCYNPEKPREYANATR